jgi:protein translocase SecG subunit
MDVGSVLPYIQIGICVLLVAAILLQQSAAGMGGAMGADNFSAAFHTRRGLERVLFIGTIILGVLFAAASFVALIVR